MFDLEVYNYIKNKRHPKDPQIPSYLPPPIHYQSKKLYSRALDCVISFDYVWYTSTQSYYTYLRQFYIPPYAFPMPMDSESNNKIMPGLL